MPVMSARPARMKARIAITLISAKPYSTSPNTQPMTSAINAPKRYVTITPGPASRIVTVLPRNSPTPIALPIAIMAIWRGTSARFRPSSVGGTEWGAYLADQRNGLEWPRMPQIDVGRRLDEGHWGGYQKWLVCLTALTIVFDGIDNQLLGVAMPSIMREWSVPRAAFSPVV